MQRRRLRLVRLSAPRHARARTRKPFHLCTTSYFTTANASTIELPRLAHRGLACPTIALARHDATCALGIVLRELADIVQWMLSAYRLENSKRKRIANSSSCPWCPRPSEQSLLKPRCQMHVYVAVVCCCSRFALGVSCAPVRQTPTESDVHMCCSCEHRYPRCC